MVKHDKPKWSWRRWITTGLAVWGASLATYTCYADRQDTQRNLPRLNVYTNGGPVLFRAVPYAETAHGRIVLINEGQSPVAVVSLAGSVRVRGLDPRSFAEIPVRAEGLPLRIEGQDFASVSLEAGPLPGELQLPLSSNVGAAILEERVFTMPAEEFYSRFGRELSSYVAPFADGDSVRLDWAAILRGGATQLDSALQAAEEQLERVRDLLSEGEVDVDWDEPQWPEFEFGDGAFTFEVGTPYIDTASFSRPARMVRWLQFRTERTANETEGDPSR